MTRTRWVVLFLTLVLVLGACGGDAAAPAGEAAPVNDLAPNRDGYVDISVDQLAGMLEEKDFTMVNVHIPYQGEIPQTDLFIPFDEIQNHLGELPAKDAPIVLYCRSGSMSATAARVLVEEGYTNVMELDGGFNAWRATGYELLDTR